MSGSKFVARILRRWVPAISHLDLANGVTAFNVVLAIVASVLAVRGQLIGVPFVMFSAALLDFVDGHLARTYYGHLAANRSFGAQLDTLADLLNFSVVPALVICGLEGDALLNALAAGALILSAALRLALFSTLKGERDYIGVPTTYSGLVLAIVFLFVATRHTAASVAVVVAFGLAGLQLLNIRVRKYSATRTLLFMSAAFLCATAVAMR